MIIAIDGPAGAGKSSVARAAAAELQLRFLDTGSMYRAVALLVLRAGVSATDEAACAEIARRAALEFDLTGRLLLDGQLAGAALRSREVGAIVSRVAEHPPVRACMVEKQRALAHEWGGLVAEGRDMTTVVFPHAEHKFYLDASSRERARRRAAEEGVQADARQLAAIEREIEGRDRIDSTRACAPLRRCPEAVYIDTDGLSESAVIERVLARVRGERHSEAVEHG
jgi:cytidylate kinase